MNWAKVKLESLYEVHNGLAKGRKYFGEGYPFLSFSTVFNNFFLPDELVDLVQSTEKERTSYSIKRGDVFVTRTSETSHELGMSCVALKDYPDATYNGFTKRMRPTTDKVLPEFIGYYMRTPEFRDKFQAFSTMTTRASLRNEDLLGIEISLPTIEIQQRIAEILSNYDALIANQQQQIKLLEEAAQRLYKEWFVDLRFPGCEKVEIVDGVPKGWKQGILDELCELRKEKASPDDVRANTPYIGLEHMPRKDFCLSSWGSAEEVAGVKSRYYEDDIIFGKIRPYFHKVGFAINSGITSTDTFVVIPIENYWSLVLMVMSSEAFVDYTSQTCKEGAKMPRADWKFMKNYKVAIPPIEAMKKFDKHILPITEKLKMLAKQNLYLQEARDRLLPKLISGEIEVSS